MPRLLLILMLWAASACDRNMEPFVPGEQPEKPDLSEIFPPGATRAVARAPATPPLPPGAPQAAPSAAPISGTVTLAPELAERAARGAVLFLIARAGEAGPPLAVQRVEAPGFPFDFAIGPEDRMISSRPFVGPLRISARLDADGNATTRSPGDLHGVADGSYPPGASGVVVVIDEAL